MRRLRERGTVALEIGPPDLERIPGLLDEGFAVEASGWKGEDGTAIESQPETSRFYRQAAGWAASRGLLHLAFLRLDDRPLAFEYSLRDERGHYRLKVGFDHSFSAFAPGKLLLRAVIEDAFAHGLETFEFLGGAEPYKLEWSSGLRDLVVAEVFGPTARGRAAHLEVTLARPAARRARAVLKRR
jgi:CelD/BcsL family acetyltransferase involved in cellulose biosynthesis